MIIGTKGHKKMGKSRNNWYYLPAVCDPLPFLSLVIPIILILRMIVLCFVTFKYISLQTIVLLQLLKMAHNGSEYRLGLWLELIPEASE